MSPGADGVLAALRSGVASPIGRRLASGALSNLLDKLTLLAVQLISIPVLSRYWGAEGYGIWLMLMTIPTYVAVSDFGLGTAAGVEITQRMAGGDTSGALETFQSAWTMTAAVLLAAALFAGSYAALVLTGVIGGTTELAVAVLLVTLYAIVAVQMTTLALVYRATHKFALAMLISAAVIAAEGIALIGVVISGGQLVEAALALLVVRMLGWLATYSLLRRLEPWLRLGLGSARLSAVRRLARPSAAAFSLTVASSISLQGMVLVLGWIAGPVAAAVFGAARFLARVPLQFSGLLVRASIPELTRAQVSSDGTMIRRLGRLNVASALAPTLPMIPILSLLGPMLLETMSGGELSADWWLFALLSSATMLSALWQAASSPLLAANQQGRFAYVYAVLSILALAAVALPGVSPILAAGTASLSAELAIAVVVLRLARRNARAGRERDDGDGDRSASE